MQAGDRVSERCSLVGTASTHPALHLERAFTGFYRSTSYSYLSTYIHPQTPKTETEQRDIPKTVNRMHVCEKKGARES